MTLSYNVRKGSKRAFGAEFAEWPPLPRVGGLRSMAGRLEALAVGHGEVGDREKAKDQERVGIGSARRKKLNSNATSLRLRKIRVLTVHCGSFWFFSYEDGGWT